MSSVNKSVCPSSRREDLYMTEDPDRTASSGIKFDRSESIRLSSP